MTGEPLARRAARLAAAAMPEPPKAEQAQVHGVQAEAGPPVARTAAIASGLWLHGESYTQRESVPPQVALPIVAPKARSPLQGDSVEESRSQVERMRVPASEPADQEPLARKQARRDGTFAADVESRPGHIRQWE